jgi:putative PEP-CTERM system TPR-repeat lipoprotein
MLQLQSGRLWHGAAFAAAMAVVAGSAAGAKEPAASLAEAEQYLARGDLKAAAIELKNAVRDSPQDAALRSRLAKIYLRLGDAAAAEREARTAVERGAEEADYLPVLADALLRQYKFDVLRELIQPGDRAAAFESEVRTALGTAAAGLRDRDRAETLLRDAIRLDPSAARPKLQLAQLLNAKNPEDADKLIDEAIAADPRSAEPLQVRGEMLRARGDLDGALHLFRQALQLDPGNLKAVLGRAEAHLARGEFTAADADLDPILQAAPDNFMANYLRGLEQVKQQQYADAVRTLDHISSVFRVFPAGYYLQGAAKFALGQFDQAEPVLAEYLDSAPEDRRAVWLLATAALKQHGAPRAIEYLKLSLDKSPADAATLTLLGNAYLADSKPELALQRFEDAAALDPENPMIKRNLAISEIDAGRTEQGVEELERLFAGGTGASVTGPTLVLNELRAGRVGKAAEVAAALIQSDADNPLYLTLLGEVRAAQQDYPAAETMFRAALSHDPEFTPATRDLAQLYRATGRSGDARKVYADLLAKHDDDMTAVLGLAEIAIAERKWAEAIDRLEGARAVAKHDPAPGLKLVNLYELRADWNNARAVAVALGEQFPRDANVAEAQGRTRLEAGDAKGALASYKQAHQLAPSSARILSRYVALLRQAGYFRDARDVLQDAVEQDPHNASIKADLIRVEAELYGLDTALYDARGFAKSDPGNALYDLVSAEIYEKAGRLGKAVLQLEKATAARPSDDLTVALARLHIQMGDLAKAEAVLNARLQTDAKSIAAATALAPLYLMTGRPDAAKRVYGDVLSQKPNDIDALLGLADIAIAEKNWPEATGYLARASSAAPNDPATGLRLVNMYVLRQDWKNATAAAAELVDKFPANLDVIDMRGKTQLGAGDTGGAIATYKRAHAIAPNSMPIFASYLALLRSTKNFVEARAVLRGALNSEHPNPSLKADLIRVEADIGGLEAGLAAARNLAKDDPENSLYDEVSAELCEDAGRREDAVDLLEKAATARPSNSDLVLALSGIYRRGGESVKAEAVLKARLQADPKDTAARSALAALYFEQKKYAAAAAEDSRLVEDRPADAAALSKLAWLYQRQGDLATARELAQRAFAIAPRDPYIDDTLGWILLGQGEADRATTFLSAANLSAPRNPDIQYHLAVALHRAGRSGDARALLETLLGSGLSFAERAEAEKLLQELQHG